ncbi:type 1 glutamine amidotransferase [Gorillibacterium sp. CAU 1737]|uniref:type 1 glutamine amidotransferase n=1 Tax=Gorillibacterium sp. CAU 1737 TaxID=3140362 RepID=UPI0032608822
MRLHYLQHIALENPGHILGWAKKKGHNVTQTRFFAGEPLPQVEDLDWLIVMGGSMNIYEEDQFPWLAAEKAFLRSAIEEHKLVLGICLGAQLLTDVIGGKVTANDQPEIGWWPVTWSEEARTSPLFAHFPESSTVFHWHYDTFSTLPPEAKVLASSPVCRNQAFQYRDHVIGLQFHLENTEELLEGYVQHFAGELNGRGYVQTPEQILAQRDYVAENNRWMEGLLDKLEESWSKKSI